MAMSFVSKAWSSETLARGLMLARTSSHSILRDPDAEALKEELEQLQDLCRSADPSRTVDLNFFDRENEMSIKYIKAITTRNSTT